MYKYSRNFATLKLFIILMSQVFLEEKDDVKTPSLINDVFRRHWLVIGNFCRFRMKLKQ